MKKVAIVIPTKNRKEMLDQCINSILASDDVFSDIYVIDNASVDGTEDMILEKYSDKVELTVNKIGKGSSGGFNIGLKKAIEGNYKYILCCDDDVRFDSKAIQALCDFLDNNSDVAVVGSKIYLMDDPQRLQEFGSFIDFDKFDVRVDYRNQLDNSDIPSVVYCDYVPACALMIRRDVIKQIGVMRDENFVYWDDMDLCYRSKLSGYKVASYAKSKVWHKMGESIPTTTSHFYYFKRNRIRFFMRYCDDTKREEFCNCLLDEMFKTIYGCMMKNQRNKLISVQYAYDDAVYGNLGEADDSRIRPIDESYFKLEAVIKKSTDISIDCTDTFKGLSSIVEKIYSINNKIRLGIIGKVDEQIVSYMKQMYPIDIDILEKYPLNSLKLFLCEHVTKVEQYLNNLIYIDEFLNLISSQQEFNYWANYKNMLDIYKEYHKPILIEQCRKLYLEK